MDSETVDAALKRIIKGCADAGHSINNVTVTALVPAYVVEDVNELVDILKSLAYHNFSVSTEDAPPEPRLELERLVEQHDMAEAQTVGCHSRPAFSNDLKRISVIARDRRTARAVSRAPRDP